MLGGVRPAGWFPLGSHRAAARSRVGESDRPTTVATAGPADAAEPADPVESAGAGLVAAVELTGLGDPVGQVPAGSPAASGSDPAASDGSAPGPATSGGSVPPGGSVVLAGAVVLAGDAVPVRPAGAGRPRAGIGVGPLPAGPHPGPMRMGVIDIGSNTVHLLVVDAHRGGQPQPAASVRVPLRLVELLEADGSLGTEGEQALTACVRDMREQAEALGVQDLAAFATSALRDASNGDQVLARVRAATGVGIGMLSGEEEARLTFLAARRWFGWSAGRLLALDIGGGSLEIGAGMHEDPEVVASLPLGASRLTRDWLAGADNDPPRRADLAELRRYVRAQIAPVVGTIYHLGEHTRVVATSKTFRSLARIAGAEPYSRGPYTRRVLRRDDLADVVAKITRMTVEERAALAGVSASRAGQLVAGAIVAAEALDLFSVEEAEICPWALREGVILRRLDWLNSG
ncbi:Ppx/GppA family phosphatase [Frankia sp. Ag45/Mut15]|uniref:Ppx/GppA family phosphatase n=2 Tax=Frankia umida TaxID=573489 RepID=A0ABT0JT52_9ACTN|nr:Ppx/GppA phosphatase family protein [Frankia umida]MCK9874745.1 Ppx/GppA family phosphatase [Frankia umida]